MKPLMRRKLCTIAETLVLLKRLTDQRNLTDHHTKIPKKLGTFTIMTKFIGPEPLDQRFVSSRYNLSLRTDGISGPVLGIIA